MVARLTGSSRSVLPIFSAKPRGKTDAAREAAETEGAASVETPEAFVGAIGERPSNGRSANAFRAAAEEMIKRPQAPTPTDVLRLALSIATGGAGRIVSPGVEDALTAKSAGRPDDAVLGAVVDLANRAYGALSGGPRSAMAEIDRRA